MKLSIITLLMTVLTTGFMTGIFFTWTNAVMPGIGKLSNLEFLKALQSMNRVILNPLFYISFIAPMVLFAMSLFFNYTLSSNSIFRLLFAAAIIYILGVFFITVLGNIPLNNLLDQSQLEMLNLEELQSLRTQIEVPWNQFNLIRTLSSFSSFVFLLIATFLLYQSDF